MCNSILHGFQPAIREVAFGGYRGGVDKVGGVLFGVVNMGGVDKVGGVFFVPLVLSS